MALSDVYSPEALEKAAQEEPFEFRCDECGAPILIDDYYWKIGDEVYCEECINNARRKY